MIKRGLVFVLGISLILSIFLIGGIFALTTCDKTSISKNTTIGSTPSSETISCTNNNNFSVQVFKSGSFFSTNPSDPITIGSGLNQVITLNFNQISTIGSFFGVLSFNDGTSQIPISVYSEESQSAPCEPVIFPLSLSNVKILQGEKKIRNILLSIPSCYKSSVTVQGIMLQTDSKPITLSELSLGQINPGGSLTVPLELDATSSVSSGTYQDTLVFLLYNSTGGRINVPSVSISVMVEASINPLGNFSLQDVPTCSLDKIELNLNNSAKMTCTRGNPNIEIVPEIDQNYLRGIGVTETSSQYIYEFKGVKIGNTQFKATFKYMSAPVGSQFVQDVKITNSGSSVVTGTSMNFSFYQGGQPVDISNLISTSTTVLALDGKTKSVIPGFSLLLNGVSINNTFDIVAGNTYELRAIADGYTDLVSIFTAQQAIISITLEPYQSFYKVGDIINITTNPNETSLTVNDNIITSPYTFGSAGTFELKAIKQGYTTTNQSLVVKGTITASCDPKYENWKKGSKVICELTESSNWITSIDGVTLNQGNGTRVEFTLKKGVFTLTANDETVFNKIIENQSFWRWNNWILWTIALVLIVCFFIYSKGKHSEKADDKLQFGGVAESEE